MNERYLVDLNNEDHWMYPAEYITPQGNKSEDQRTIFLSEGPGSMFTVTDSVMYPTPPGLPDGVACHEHQRGWEDFFVDDGTMDLFVNGMKTLVTPGDIIHLQNYEAHGMTFHSPVKYRGFFHHLVNYESQAELYILRKKNPQIMQDPDFMRVRATGYTGGGRDFYVREKPIWEEVPVEQNSAIRNIKRPLMTFKLDGITMKMMTRRWENGGHCEMWAMELDQGFKAVSDKYLNHSELYYITAGQVKFRIWEDEYIAGPECVVKVPALANFDFTATKDSVMYDVGGVSRWQAYLSDRASVLQYDPERAKDPAVFETMRTVFGVQLDIGLTK